MARYKFLYCIVFSHGNLAVNTLSKNVSFQNRANAVSANTFWAEKNAYIILPHRSCTPVKVFEKTRKSFIN